MAKYAICLILLACSNPTVDPAQLTDTASALTLDGGDIERIALRFDLDAFKGNARYDIKSQGLAEIWLEVAELDIDAVTDEQGHALDHLVENGRLIVPAQGDRTTLFVDFRFHAAQDNASHRGYDTETGATTTWPNHCGALFPCHSSPADGIRWSMDVTGGPAVYAPSIDFDAPSYMLAFATGWFHIVETEQATHAGTRVRYYTQADPDTGLEHMLETVRDAFDWYERTLGRYEYGHVVGGIAVGAAFGGCMEHHPFWHCQASTEDNRHESAHGWFGNAVWLKCWEDIAVSEAFTEYLAQRAPRALAGDDGGWSINNALANPGNNRVWVPETCSLRAPNDAWIAVYKKGPAFFKELANTLGTPRVDQLITGFYQAHKGHAVRFQDFLDFVREDAGFDASPLANKWLR